MLRLLKAEGNKKSGILALAETDSPSRAKIFIDILQDINEDCFLRKDAARILGVLKEKVALEPHIADL